jgi:hypothetical protein
MIAKSAETFFWWTKKSAKTLKVKQNNIQFRKKKKERDFNKRMIIGMEGPDENALWTWWLAKLCHNLLTIKF